MKIVLYIGSKADEEHKTMQIKLKLRYNLYQTRYYIMVELLDMYLYKDHVYDYVHGVVFTISEAFAKSILQTTDRLVIQRHHLDILPGI